MRKYKTTALIIKEIDLRKNLFLDAVIIVELFVMFLMSFPRLDDLTWGSEIGIQRLSTWFAGYNGRYIGNIVVIILTRLPAGIRATVELVILCTLVYYAHRLLPKVGMFCFFVLALLTLPLNLYAQSVVWTAGFANYTTSAVVLLFVLDIYCRVVLQKEKLSPVHHGIFALVGFLGQLILENTTIFMVVLAFCVLFYSWVKEKKICTPIITGIISSLAGALLMFSNSSYYSALVGDGNNYKAITTSIIDLLRKYQNDVVPHLVQNNHILNLVLVIALLLLWLTAKPKGQKFQKIGCLFGGMLCAFFCYDMVDSFWTKAIPHGKTIYMVVTLFYAMYIVVTVLFTVTEKREQTMLLLFSFSQIVLAAPLVMATPLSARCFFQNGILWCMILGYIFQILIDRCAIQFDRGVAEKKIITIMQVIYVCYLAFSLCGQSLSWRIQKLRLETTQDSLARGVETIVLSEVPWSSLYCFGANISNTNNYWLANYRRYYGIPDDVKLSFMDYYKWMEQYGDR